MGLKPRRHMDLKARQRQTLKKSRGEQIGLDTARARLILVIVGFMVGFGAISLRLFDLMIVDHQPVKTAHRVHREKAQHRADIIDRNGIVLATSLKTASVYADPKLIMDPSEAASRIARVMPSINEHELYEKLSSGRRFVWIKRGLSPRDQYLINRLGIPGVEFIEEEQRFYPHGELTAHLVGYTDVDNNGIAGVEKGFDDALKSSNEPLTLSLDLRVQQAVHESVREMMHKHNAKGGVGVVMDVHTGELVASVSLPDFNPKTLDVSDEERLFNRSTLGVYEMGSTFKLFTAAMALDYGTSGFSRIYETKDPIKVARFLVRDHRSYGDKLSMPEVIMYSSNIGSAKMALEVGVERQREFFERLRLTEPTRLEIPENGQSLLPSRWDDVTLHTLSYGYGLSVTPIKLAQSVSALVNGGMLRPVTILKTARVSDENAVRIIKPQTSEKMRQLMYMTVQEGTGKKAANSGYMIGGKTGTALKNTRGGYSSDKMLASFVSAFPIHDPKYVVFVMLDEPKGTKETFGFANGGWVAAPAAKQIVQRMAPLVGIKPFSPHTTRDNQGILNVRY